MPESDECRVLGSSVRGGLRPGHGYAWREHGKKAGHRHLMVGYVTDELEFKRQVYDFAKDIKLAPPGLARAVGPPATVWTHEWRLEPRKRVFLGEVKMPIDFDDIQAKGNGMAEGKPYHILKFNCRTYCFRLYQEIRAPLKLIPWT